MIKKIEQTKPIKNEYLDNVFGSIKNLNDLRYELLDLSKAFRLTGNQEMAKQLQDIALDIQINAECIRSAVGKEIHDQYKQSEKDMTETLKLCLDRIIAP